MSENMIYVPLEDFERKCNAESELNVVKRYLVGNRGYSLLDDLRTLLGMEDNDK